MGALTRWTHIVVLALVLPLALSSAMPIFASVLAGPPVHVCHCAINGGHSTCGCPICNPDRDDLRLNEASLRGKCGDDDLSFGASLGFAVLPAAGFTLLRADLTAELPPRASSPLLSVFAPPPTPPPRLPRV